MGTIFQRLLFKTLLEKAILAEEKAFNFYHILQDDPSFSMCSPLLQKLASAELGHRIKLEKVQKTLDLGVLNPSSEEETILLLEHNGPWCDPEKKENIEQILLLAMEKEEASYAFYTILREKTKNALAKKIFQQLAEEEKSHIEWVQNVLDNGEV